MGTDKASDSAYQQFRQLLAARRLQPGDRVPSIRELAQRFGAGIVAVRDALVQAEREGIVEIRPRSGAFIRSLDGIDALASPREEVSLRVVDGHQLHLCQARELLEVEMAGQAALRCRPADLLPIREALQSWHRGRAAGDTSLTVASDCRFHVEIARLGGNPVIADILAQCLRQQYMQECSIPEGSDDSHAVAVIHNEIYEALRDCDADRARDAMRRHMKHLENNIQKMLLMPPSAALDQREATQETSEAGS